MQAPKLRRGPFGYSSRSVHLVLADRDASLAQASQRAGAAEAQVLDLRSEAETLRTQLEDLRTDRDAARRELEGAVADAVRLQLQLTATRRQLETMQSDQEAIQLGSEAARGGPDLQDEPVRAAEEGSGEIALIREELTSARRHFLIQSQQIMSAEARIEVLETEVRSLRPELEAGLSAAVADLQAARAAVDEVAVRTAPDPSVTAEDAAAPEGALVEIERLAASRDRLASLVGEVRSTIEDAGEGAAGIGDRVDEAVAPLAGAIHELNLRLAAFAELAEVPSEDTREPGTERSLNLVRLEERDDAEDQPDPADGVGARSHDPHAEEAPEPAFEWIVPPAPPPVDRAQRSR